MHRCVAAVALLVLAPALARAEAAVSEGAARSSPAVPLAQAERDPAPLPTSETIPETASTPANPSTPAPTTAPASTEETITARPIPSEVEEAASSAPESPTPAEAASALATAARPHVPTGNTVYLRFAPAALAVFGRALGDAQAPYFPDLLELGVGLGKLDGSFILRSQSPFARRNEYSAWLPSVALAYRPLRDKQLALVDFYFQATLAAGGVGQLVQAPSCDPERLTGNQQCGDGHDGFGIGASLGIGVEVNLRLGEVPGGQLAYLTLGLELRAHDVVSFRTIAPSTDTTVGNNLFGVVAIPIGVRFE